MKNELIKGNLFQKLLPYILLQGGLDLNSSANYRENDLDNELNELAMVTFQGVSDELQAILDEEFSKYESEDGEVLLAEDTLQHYETLA
jgi:hypothetical protein